MADIYNEFIEEVAIEFCHELGIDPSTTYSTGMPANEDGVKPLGLVQKKYWETMVPVVESHFALVEAISKVKARKEDNG